jgi:hypothetical protein
MMRFPIRLLHSERNDKLCSDNVYNVFAISKSMELDLKQAEAVSPPRSILYSETKQTVIQKFQNVGLPFKMWIDFLLNNDWVARCKKTLYLFFLHILNCFNYKNTICKIRLQVQKQTLFPDIVEEVKNSEN